MKRTSGGATGAEETRGEESTNGTGRDPGGEFGEEAVESEGVTGSFTGGGGLTGGFAGAGRVAEPVGQGLNVYGGYSIKDELFCDIPQDGTPFSHVMRSVAARSARKSIHRQPLRTQA